MKLTRTLAALLAFGIVSAVGAPGYAENGAEAVTYYKDVLPIMQENCQTCHRPSGANIQRARRPDVVHGLPRDAALGPLDRQQGRVARDAAVVRLGPQGRVRERARPDRRRDRHHPELGRGRRARGRHGPRPAGPAVRGGRQRRLDSRHPRLRRQDARAVSGRGRHLRHQHHLLHGADRGHPPRGHLGEGLGVPGSATTRSPTTCARR